MAKINLSKVANLLRQLADELECPEEEGKFEKEEMQTTNWYIDVCSAIAHFRSWIEFNSEIDGIVNKYGLYFPKSWLSTAWTSFANKLNIKGRLNDFVKRQGFDNVFDFIETKKYNELYFETIRETFNNK